MFKFNVFGGEHKVPTGTYTNHHAPRQDTTELIQGVSWHLDGTGEYNMYIDEALLLAFEHGSEMKKYGWLLEGKAIIPNIYGFFVDNLDAFMNVFEIVFTSDRSIYELHDRIHFVPANTLWVKEPKLYPKTKLVSMISSSNADTSGHMFRLNWMNKLLGHVDVYGRQINPIDRKEDGLADYMFSVAMENSSYPTYFTEKILDCFATGTIPIYWGSPDIADYFNPDGIIMLTDDFTTAQLSPELYESKIEAVKENFERVKEYTVLENYMYNHYLKELL